MVALGEAWGYHIGYFLTIQEFGNNNGVLTANAFENFDPLKRTNNISSLRYADGGNNNTIGWTGWIPSGIMQDLIDTNSDVIGEGFNDNASGYSIKNIYNALDSDVESPQAFRNRLLLESDNRDANDVKNSLKLITGINNNLIMKKILPILLLVFTILSCTKEDCIESKIFNDSNTDLILFFYKNNSSKELEIFKNNSKTDIQTCDEGIILNYKVLYDSVSVKNSQGALLKIYKQETVGKNILDLENYWTKSKPSKNFYKYTYNITDEDIE